MVDLRRRVTLATAFALALTASVFGTGYGKLKQKVQEHVVAVANAATALVGADGTEATAAGSLFTDATSIPAQFGAKLGGPVKILELTVHPGRATAQLQDPKKHENVDQFLLSNGSVETEGPVKFMGKSPTAKVLDSICVDAATLDFAIVPKIVKDAPERLKIENGKVSHMIFKRNLPFSRDAVWRVYVDGPRNDGSVEYDVKGTMRKVYY